MRSYIVTLRDAEGLDRSTDRADLVQANTAVVMAFRQKLETLIKARKMEKQLGHIRPMGAVRALTVLATPAIADMLKMQREVDAVVEDRHDFRTTPA